MNAHRLDVAPDGNERKGPSGRYWHTALNPFRRRESLAQTYLIDGREVYRTSLGMEKGRFLTPDDSVSVSFSYSGSYMHINDMLAKPSLVTASGKSARGVFIESGVIGAILTFANEKKLSICVGDDSRKDFLEGERIRMGFNDIRIYHKDMMLLRE